MSLHLAVKMAKEFIFGSRCRASKEKAAPSYMLYYAAKCLLAVQNSAGKFNQNPQKSNISESTTQNIPTKRICASFAKKYQRILATQVNNLFSDVSINRGNRCIIYVIE